MPFRDLLIHRSASMIILDRHYRAKYGLERAQLPRASLGARPSRSPRRHAAMKRDDDTDVATEIKYTLPRYISLRFDFCSATVIAITPQARYNTSFHFPSSSFSTRRFRAVVRARGAMARAQNDFSLGFARKGAPSQNALIDDELRYFRDAPIAGFHAHESEVGAPSVRWR